MNNDLGQWDEKLRNELLCQRDQVVRQLRDIDEALKAVEAKLKKKAENLTLACGQ